MNKKLLVHAWSVEKKSGNYYLPYAHWIYLKEIIKYFDEVVLLSPCKLLGVTGETKGFDIQQLGNIKVHELPSGSGGYINALKHFGSYLKAYRCIKGVTSYYARYPTPFGWLQRLYGGGALRTIHYVGDPVGAARSNPNFSALKKKILIGGFFIENFLYDWACKGAKIYTNGDHLAEKLNRKRIPAIALISSTLTGSDFNYEDKVIDPEYAKFVYLGNLRTAKGVETVIRAFGLYNEKYRDSSFTIIGSGEFESQLREIALKDGIKNLNFLGRIDERSVINKELRKADIFLFGSLSEGSPRVVLEAMANGLAVISTPVGSLPGYFNDKRDILFSEFNNHQDFFEKMECLSNDNAFFNELRSASYSKVQDATIDNFIKKIFYE